MTASSEASARRLTPKGLATRERIIKAAAELIYEHGVQNTNNEQIRAATGVSGSQLTRHFPTKESLVRAVLAWQADTIVARHQVPDLGELDSFVALRRWADSYIASQDMVRGGCTFGSLAAEVVKADPSHRDAVADGFERWQELFRRGLGAMRERGELRPEADPVALAHLLAAAFQGGALLDQAADDSTPLRDALYGALAYIESFAVQS
ncbi:putative HTH-type transcriptional regulator YxaF [Streptomyces sp. MBT84]|uniref:TetR/AcrR family transcriptional regulator n=1 Tax=unclassified Streptomyces TaxID=2593676 RepID=UPI001C6DDA7D|nr:TetR/AcrR family transcriptional regulator [Streptomyces sp. MBT84]MBW8707514.1 putative HTH-type transcriptional regulator YxaF [Streptomyces sp. MBT84]